MSRSSPAVLVLEDGRCFRGEAYGAIGETVGEAVFATGMTGYQETLTDPSYRRQVVVMTAPHIGNTGVNDDDPESDRIWVAGYVVRDPARRPSNWRSQRRLDEELTVQGIVGISGIDTRALTRHLRERGAMRIGISSVSSDVDALLETVRAAPTMEGADLTGEVTTTEPYVVPAQGERRGTVAAIDLGIKAMMPQLLSARGLDVHVLPSTATIDDVEAAGADGVFFSNGPGDPATADRAVELLREVLRREIPYFGICFGNQLFGRALGLGTYKLRYGHRGINQPVVDRTTGKVEVTAHNHGFAVAWPDTSARSGEYGPVETEFGPAEVTHVCLNDGVIEGLRLLERPAFSVQYHPEAAAGPHDASYLFGRFVEMLSGAIRPPGRMAPDNSTGEEA
ncbi:MAG TPA: glutamine-hydrolyzing carbamoyl-phosphate synthase small subunit [Nocardioidaceae bacterium]|nr:glutamine-hydrolyzing carbamoyl-phosphate synthase small subunit [Nocardioidaceae bacterium]